MSQEWYYAKGDQKHGPITSVQLKTLARSGELMPTDLVWTEGMTDWRQASFVQGLVPPQPSAPPPLKAKAAAKSPMSETAEIDVAVGGVVGSIPQQPWYCHWAVLTLTTLFCFPATWVLVWWKSTYSKPGRWAWTVAACFIAAVYASNNGAKDVSPAVPQASAIKTPEISVLRPQADGPSAAISDNQTETSRQTVEYHASTDYRKYEPSSKPYWYRDHDDDSLATKNTLETLRRNGTLTPVAADSVREAMKIAEGK